MGPTQQQIALFEDVPPEAVQVAYLTQRLRVIEASLRLLQREREAIRERLVEVKP